MLTKHVPCKNDYEFLILIAEIKGKLNHSIKYKMAQRYYLYAIHVKTI
jgi:hypothetical protein